MGSYAVLCSSTECLYLVDQVKDSNFTVYKKVLTLDLIKMLNKPLKSLQSLFLMFSSLVCGGAKNVMTKYKGQQ